MHLTRYLKQFDEETNKLPRYLARIRTGNEEEIRFFQDIEAKSGFMSAQNITEEEAEEVITRQLEQPERITSQRISIHEVFESFELEKLLSKAVELGANLKLFTGGSDECDFRLNFVNDAEDKHISISSISEFLENIRRLGRKGLQIQRYKGWVK